MNKGDQMENMYDIFADFYDEVHKDYIQDIPLWIEYAQTWGSPILELACGTGRALIPLAKEGFEITGLDSNESMLKKAKEKIKKVPQEIQNRIKLIKSDMTDFELKEKFNLILIVFNSFQHLLTIQDQDNCLKSIHRHLKDEGRLIITVFYPDLTRPEGVIRREDYKLIQDYPEKGDKTELFHCQYFNHKKQETDVSYFLDTQKPNGQLRRKKMSFTIHYFFPTEFERMLISNGFVVEELFGNFDKSQFTGKSPFMIFVARKVS
jgi:ubiquinone/menaquinone biosynthesis C-methylase UbiE